MMSHFFKSIRIRNLLSFGPDSPELELKPINIVIGPNGSGKSNFLAAISLLAEPDRKFDRAINEGGMSAWLWKQDKKKTAVIDFETAKYKSRLVFYSAGGESWGMFFPKDDSGKHFKSLSGIFCFRDWQYGPAAPIRIGPQSIDLSNKQLRYDGRNLAHVLMRVTSNEKSNSVFMEFLSELYEDIEKIDFTEAEDYLFFFVIENGRKVPAARISDGTLRYLALLAILCDPEPPNLICLEEPEMGLHPDLIQVVAKAIKYASERTQVIATTHSVSLVDKFTDSPESIVVCEKIDGSTELRRLDPEEMAPWLEKYRLGDLWTSGQIGGNRW